MKLSTRLSVLFALLALMVTAVLGWLAFENGRGTIERHIIHHLRTTTMQKEVEIERWVDGTCRMLEILARGHFFRHQFVHELDLHDLDHPSHPLVHDHVIQEHLLPFLDRGGFIELFVLRADDGLVLLSTDSAQEGKYKESEPYFLHGREGIFVTNVYYSMTLRQPAMTVATPLRDQNDRLIGVLAGRVDLSALTRIMEHTSWLTRTEKTYLVNKFNYFVTEPRFETGYALKKSVHTEGVVRALERRDGVAHYVDFRGVPVVGGYHWIPSRELALITEIDEAEAYAPIEELKRSVLILGSCMVPLAFLLGSLCARTLTRPIDRLLEGTRQVAAGNLDYDVTMTGHDEIGELSRSFGEMTERLKATLVSRDELAREIAERKQIEEALRASEARLRRAEALGHVGNWSFDLRNKVSDWSDEMYRICGFDPTLPSPGRREFMERVFPEDREIYKRAMDLIFEEGEGSYEFRMVRPDGEVRHLIGRGEVLLDASGGKVALFGTVMDVTELKRAEEALRESERRLRVLYNETPILLHSLDLEGRLERVNDYWLEVLGYERAEVIGRPWVDFLAEESRARAGASVLPSFFADGHVKDIPYQVKRKDGSTLHVLLSASVEKDSAGRYVRSLAAMKDITPLKRAEEERIVAEAQLRQAQKMEALGTLAGGIAHDFNNILGIIIGYGEIARWSLPDEARVREALAEILKAADRAKDLVQQILAFSRQGEQEKRPVQVSLLCKEALKMLRATIPSTIQIHSNIESRSAIIGDPTQIHQVLMNLCTNAAHAMRETGGTLEVTLTDQVLSGEEARKCGMEPGPCVALVVRDTGHGIDPAMIGRIFDPFFTTKEKGVGTGLGLAVVHGIVKGAGGSVAVESEVGQGAVFTIRFPSAPTSAEKDSREPPLPRGRERILVVDDEADLATAMVKMLESLGYEAECRTSGVEALEAFRRQDIGRPFDVVITDMTMPILTGAALAGELLALRPDLPIILCTGFSEIVSRERLARIGITGFLLKPVTIRDLAEMVRRVLDGRA